VSLNAFGTGERHLAAALEVTSADDPERPMLLFALGRAVFEREGALSLLEEAAVALSSVGEFSAAATAEIFCARACWYAGLRDEADEHSKRAVALLEHEPASDVKADAFAERARLLMLACEYDAARDLATVGLEIAEEVGAGQAQASLLITRGAAYIDRSDSASARVRRYSPFGLRRRPVVIRRQMSE
jgi:tetratricopeptide (TPR) repeat protein